MAQGGTRKEVNHRRPTPSAEHVESELVRMLHQAPWLMSLIVGLAASCSTAYLFYGALPPVIIILWLVLLNGIILGRVFLLLKFRRSLPSPVNYSRSRSQYTALVWCNGMAWGLPAFALDSTNLSLVYFYAIVLGGFIAGAIPGLSFHPRAFNGFACFSVGPLVWFLISNELTSMRILAVLSVLFVLINMTNVRITYRRILQQIELEFQNRQLVQQLTEEKERAEKATAEKSRFLAAASHDLRQPVHAVGLFLDALDEHPLPDQSRDLLASVRESAQSLTSLLQAHLDLSRLEAGVLTPVRSAIPLQSVFDKLTLEFSREASAKEIELRVRGCDAWVESDPTMLARVLRNALSNAIRHTQRGGVLLGCRRRGDHIRVEVCDTGAGISQDELEHVFEEFYQVENPQRDRRSGLGLGLAIVRHLCALLGHKVELRSSPGRGTVFWLSLPVAEPLIQERSAAPPVVDNLSGARILVIDDDTSVLEAMQKILQNWSCDVLLAESGEEALQQLTAGERQLDLVIADYRLRGSETGAQVVDGVRSLLGKQVPAIIVTGDTAPDRLREARGSGHHLLHKPVAAVELRSLASYLIQQCTPLGQVETSPNLAAL